MTNDVSEEIDSSPNRVGGTAPGPAQGDRSGAAEAADGDADSAKQDGAPQNSSDSAGADKSVKEAELIHEGDIAADYLERLLDIVDFDGDIDLDVENDRALVAIVGGADLDPLIGHRGVTLDALQELTRLAVHQQTGVRSRLMLDVGGFRARRREELSALARETAESVLAGDGPKRLHPMNAFERKVVHDGIARVDGVHSESEGEDPNRRVVVSAD